MRKQNVVNLSDEERAALETIVTKGKAGARIIRRAHTLLLSAEGRTDQEIASLLHVDEMTVANTRIAMGRRAGVDRQTTPQSRATVGWQARGAVSGTGVQRSA